MISDDHFWEDERKKIIGLGGQSSRKTYYSELKSNIASLERFKSLINRVSESILLVELESELIVDTNQTAEKLFGLSQDTLLNQNIHAILPNINLHDFHEISSINHHFFLSIPQKSITIPVELDLHFSIYNNQKYCTMIIRDISQKVKQEEENKKLESQMRQTHKMESIGRLSGGIAHDFNNLLTVILGYSDIIFQNKEKLDPTLVQFLKEIYKAADSAKRLTQQLLLFSRKQNPELKPLSVSETIKNFSKMISRTLRENIKVNINIDDIQEVILGDRTQLEQMIMNLCINSQDAINDEGTIDIVVKQISIEPDFCVSISDCKPGKHILISVKDSGCGIPDDIKDKIFDPFFTTKPEGYGTGLGLSTVYAIVKQHSGFITLESEENAGTSFYIYLPISNNNKNMSDQKYNEMIKYGKGTILLAEDNENVRKSTKNILEYLGYQVMAPDNITEILELTRDFKPDLLLTDIIMPVMNGKMLYDKIKEIYPDLKVLFMSGYTDDIINQQGIANLSLNFIHKPFSIEPLSIKISQILNN